MSCKPCKDKNVVFRIAVKGCPSCDWTLCASCGGCLRDHHKPQQDQLSEVLVVCPMHHTAYLSCSCKVTVQLGKMFQRVSQAEPEVLSAWLKRMLNKDRWSDIESPEDMLWYIRDVMKRGL